MSYAQYKYSYSVNPIFLVNGIASALPGGTMSIVNLLQSQAFQQGVTGSGDQSFYDDYFAQFDVMPGGKLEDIEYGTYPYLNIATAANAAIPKPLSVSLMMVCPAKAPGSYQQKQSIMTSLKSSIDQHVNSGGYFIVATPTYIYTSALLTSLHDAGSNSRQPQIQWQWDFFQPLITSQQAQAVTNALMTRFQNGVAVQGDPPTYSGAASTVGSSQSGVTPAVVPSATSATGGGVYGPANQ